MEFIHFLMYLVAVEILRDTNQVQCQCDRRGLLVFLNDRFLQVLNVLEIEIIR